MIQLMLVSMPVALKRAAHILVITESLSTAHIFLAMSTCDPILSSRAAPTLSELLGEQQVDEQGRRQERYCDAPEEEHPGHQRDILPQTRTERLTRSVIFR
jgi:hypothetical protein